MFAIQYSLGIFVALLVIACGLWFRLAPPTDAVNEYFEITPAETEATESDYDDHTAAYAYAEDVEADEEYMEPWTDEEVAFLGTFIIGVGAIAAVVAAIFLAWSLKIKKAGRKTPEEYAKVRGNIKAFAVLHTVFGVSSVCLYVVGLSSWLAVVYTIFALVLLYSDLRLNKDDIKKSANAANVPSLPIPPSPPSPPSPQGPPSFPGFYR
jgi:hypothetical protein